MAQTLEEQIAFLDALPASEPDDEDRAEQVEIELARAAGELEGGITPAELRGRWDREDATSEQPTHQRR